VTVRTTVALLAVSLGACGGADGDDTPADTDATTAADTTEARPPWTGELAAFCPPMEQLATYNAETAQPDASGDWALVQDELLESAGGALPLYVDAIAAGPDEVRDELETLHAYNERLLEIAAGAESVDDLLAAVGAIPDDVLNATADLDAYVEEHCGFGLTALG
jgi:hypothetical protein